MLNDKAHTLTEVLVASTIVIILFASSFGAFVLAQNVYYAGVAEYNLQRDTNAIMARMIRGMKEGADSFGLRSAKSYDIPAAGRIDFVGMDGNTRSYFVTDNSIIYTSPTQSPAEDTIYAPPAGASITLRFWNPYEGQPSDDSATVGIYLAVSRTVADRPISGSSSTYVNLRNIPK